jgi:hypothetical protein
MLNKVFALSHFDFILQSLTCSPENPIKNQWITSAAFFSPTSSLTPNQDPELNAHLLPKNPLWILCSISPPLTNEPLPTPSSIRTLELLPEASHDPIKCALHVTDLATDDKVYTALSYVWGNSDDRLVINCNGQKAPVTPNLYSALLRLRNPGQSRHLWVDALCINQALVAVALRERELQVRMMDKIYTHAREVIVDLGGANLAFNALLSTFCKFNTEPLDSFKTAAREQRIVEGFEEFDFAVTLNATDKPRPYLCSSGLAEELEPVTLSVSYSECDAALFCTSGAILSESRARGVRSMSCWWS